MDDDLMQTLRDSLTWQRLRLKLMTQQLDEEEEDLIERVWPHGHPPRQAQVIQLANQVRRLERDNEYLKKITREE